MLASLRSKHRPDDPAYSQYHKSIWLTDRLGKQLGFGPQNLMDITILKRPLWNIYLMPNTTVKSCAKDLGCHVTYHGNPRLGSIHERIQKAKDRLDRIRQKPWDHLLKIHIILTSVLPVVFYGAELIYLGEHHLDSLRTHLANAM